MEFKDAGVLSYEPPSGYLKPFFRRKLKTIFRGLETIPGFVREEGLVPMAKTIAARYPEEKRQEVERVHMEEIYPHYFHFEGKDSIGEDDYVDRWMKIIFADATTRKSMMQASHKFNVHVFDYMDTNGKGEINYEQFLLNSKVYEFADSLYHLVFAALDVNNDKLISYDQFSYGLVNLYFCSGPESIISLCCGPIVD